MPIYEYQCQSCGYEFEKLQKMSDAALRDCPSCGDPELKKKVSAAAFRLKGGGWYETDFKSSDKKKNLAGDAKPTGDKPSGDKASEGKGGDKKAEKTKADTKASKPANG